MRITFLSMARVHREGHGVVFITFLIVVFLACVLFVVGGIWLVSLGAIGTTNANLFGQKVSSTNVGIPAFFFGVVALVLLLRTFLKTYTTNNHRDVR